MQELFGSTMYSQVSVSVRKAKIEGSDKISAEKPVLKTEVSKHAVSPKTFDFPKLDQPGTQLEKIPK